MNSGIIIILLIAALYFVPILYQRFGRFFPLKGERPENQALEIVPPPVRRRHRTTSSRERVIYENEFPYYDPIRNHETVSRAEVEPKYRRYRYANYPPDWERRRAMIFIKDEGRCGSCGRPCGRLACEPHQLWGFSFDEHLLYDAHVHHKVHLSSGGDHGLGNLSLYCPRCHTREHPENSRLWASVVSRTLGGGRRGRKQNKDIFRRKAPRTTDDDFPF